MSKALDACGFSDQYEIVPFNRNKYQLNRSGYLRFFEDQGDVLDWITSLEQMPSFKASPVLWLSKRSDFMILRSERIDQNRFFTEFVKFTSEWKSNEKNGSILRLVCSPHVVIDFTYLRRDSSVWGDFLRPYPREAALVAEVSFCIDRMI